MQINKLMFTQEGTEVLINSNDIQNTLSKLQNVVGEKNLKLFLPINRDFLTDQEYFNLRALSSYLSDISKSTGFDKHIQEYSNNFQTSFFVSQFASYLMAHGFVIELEPDIPGISKKPDIKAERNGIVFYFECKRPIENNNFVYQKKMFEVLKKYITNEYSLALFFRCMPSDEEINLMGSVIQEKTKDISLVHEGMVLYENIDEKLRVEVSGCQLFSEETDIFISGIPVFNHLGFESACGINFHGKNIVFYKHANMSIIENQIKKSKSKVKLGSNYIVAICTDDRRIDSSRNEEIINKIFEDSTNSEISGVILADTIMSENYDFGLEVHYYSNPNSLSDLSFINNFFARRVIRY